MKTLVLATLMLLAGFQAHAAPASPYDQDIMKDDEFAIVKATVRDVQEPAAAPLELKIWITCKGGSRPNRASQPKYLVSISAFHQVTYDPATHIVHFFYSAPEMNSKGEDVTSLVEGTDKGYNLKEYCGR